jgi:hypothetical protein
MIGGIRWALRSIHNCFYKSMTFLSLLAFFASGGGEWRLRFLKLMYCLGAG